MVFRNSDKKNGRPTASQTKLNAGSESGIAWGGWGFLREFFPNVRGPAYARGVVAASLGRGALGGTHSQHGDSIFEKKDFGKVFARGQARPRYCLKQQKLKKKRREDVTIG